MRETEQERETNINGDTVVEIVRDTARKSEIIEKGKEREREGEVERERGGDREGK